MCKKLAALITVLSILCLFCALAAYADTEEADIYSDIDKYLRACAANAHIPALSVTITDSNNVLFAESYGDGANCDTPFFIGSVSKSFTAVCIMQLAERQKIDLDAAISTYLPDAADGDKITVRQLLNHTGGLGQYQNLSNQRIVGPQGVHNYANVGFSLLGKIIEAVSGQSYSDYITENLLIPLGLSHTAATLEESIDNGLIDGHTNFFGLNIKTGHRYPTDENSWITVPAGYISSSANDLGRYLQMYLRGGDGIISQQSIDTMFYGDTVYIDGEVPYWYGYGWTTVKEPLTEPVLRHSGLVETGTACVFILPERDIAIAFTANVNDYFVTNEMLDSLSWGVVLMLLGHQPNEIPDNAYFLEHAKIDLIMLAVLAAAILWLCLTVKRFGKADRGKKLPTLLIAPAGLGAAIFIMLIVPVFFGVPLWVAMAFAPDVFVTVIVSSALFFLSAILCCIRLAIRHNKQRRAQT